MAIIEALDEADKPLMMWKLSENSKISQRRMEEIISIRARRGSKSRRSRRRCEVSRG